MRTGICDKTGKILTGWDHCIQSIWLILTTRVGTLVMHRDFGGGLTDIQDRNPTILMAAYVAIARSLRLWEPGFRLQKLAITRAGPDGVYRLELIGIYYPRGHLGDYSIKETKTTAFPGFANDKGISFVKEAA